MNYTGRGPGWRGLRVVGRRRVVGGSVEHDRSWVDRADDSNNRLKIQNLGWPSLDIRVRWQQNIWDLQFPSIVEAGSTLDNIVQCS